MIIIDPGHGKTDPGSIGPTGLMEKDITLEISKRVGNILISQGVEAGYTRTKDIFVELSERCRIANETDAEYFLSIHINSASNPTATGTETYAYGSGGVSALFAAEIQRYLVESIKLTDRGVKFANFQVLRDTNMPAALVEVCFICNPAEEALLRQEEFLDKAATGIAKGVISFLGIQWSGDEPEQSYEQGGGVIMLQRGSAGSEVSELQVKLNKLGYDLAVDGDFGAATEAAVKHFQSNFGLNSDGIAGPATLAKLDEYLSSYQEQSEIDYKSLYEQEKALREAADAKNTRIMVAINNLINEYGG